MPYGNPEGSRACPERERIIMEKPIRNDDLVSREEKVEAELRALEDWEDLEEFLDRNPEFTKRLKGLFRIVDDGRR